MAKATQPELVAEGIVEAVEEHLEDVHEEAAVEAPRAEITHVERDEAGNAVSVQALAPTRGRGRGKSLTTDEKAAMVKRVQDRVTLTGEAVTVACKALGVVYATYLKACEALGLDTMVQPRGQTRSKSPGKASRQSSPGTSSQRVPMSPLKSTYTVEFDARDLVAANRQAFIEALLEGKSADIKRTVIFLLGS